MVHHNLLKSYKFDKEINTLNEHVSLCAEKWTVTECFCTATFDFLRRWFPKVYKCAQSLCLKMLFTFKCFIKLNFKCLNLVEISSAKTVSDLILKNCVVKPPWLPKTDQFFCVLRQPSWRLCGIIKFWHEIVSTLMMCGIHFYQSTW